MSKHKKLYNIMIEECVKVEEEAPTYEMMRLRNLNVFLYQEISRLRTENKSLKSRMVSIESMARKEPHARQKPKQHRDQLEREFTGTYIPPQIEVITPEGVLVKVDPLNDAQVYAAVGVTKEACTCEHYMHKVVGEPQLLSPVDRVGRHSHLAIGKAKWLRNLRTASWNSRRTEHAHASQLHEGKSAHMIKVAVD
eukprot:Gb_35457 [translate_table: standard]